MDIVTAGQAAQEWQRGAERALKAAQDLQTTGNYELALFTCHLAVEKQIKALYIQKHQTDPPKTHNLEDLCATLEVKLSDEELKQLSELTTFSAFARYGDETWMEAEATSNNCEHWLSASQLLLQKFHL